MKGFVIILIIFILAVVSFEVMDRWDKQMEFKHEQLMAQTKPTIGLPQGATIEISGINVNMEEGTATLYMHMILGGKYYYAELKLPTEEEQPNGNRPRED